MVATNIVREVIARHLSLHFSLEACPWHVAGYNDSRIGALVPKNGILLEGGAALAHDSVLPELFMLGFGMFFRIPAACSGFWKPEELNILQANALHCVNRVSCEFQ